MAAPDSPGREFAKQMKSFDSNNDGSLTAEELQAGLVSMGVSKSASEAYMSAGDKIEIKEGTDEMNVLQGKLSKLAEMKSALAEAEKARDKAEEERQAAEGALRSKRANEIAQEEAKRLEEKQISQLQHQQEEDKDGKNRAAEERAATERAQLALEMSAEPLSPRSPNSKQPSSGKKRGGPVDKRMVSLLARLVDERMNQEFSQRDQILNQMKDAMEVMRHELERNVAMLSPAPPSGPSPVIPKVSPAINRRSLHQAQKKHAVTAGKAKPRNIDRDENGRLQTSLKNMPRVARIVPDDPETKALLRAQAKKAEKLYSRAVVKYPECRSTVFMPSTFTQPLADEENYPPATSLDLEFVHGYSGKTPFQECKADNIFMLTSGEIVYPASATVVMYHKGLHQQRFFHGHDDDVTSLAVHPDGSMCASGQVGRKPPICVWDSGASGGQNGGGDNGIYHMGNLMLHERRVCALDFSGDGQLLASVGGDDYHTVALWDWQNGVLLAQARGHNANIYKIGFNPYHMCGVQDVEDIDDITYTLVTCGDRHIKFWSLKRVDVSDSGGDNKDMATKDSRKKKQGQLQGTSNKIWRLDGNAGTFGRKGKVQHINCFVFMTSGRVIAGTENGDMYLFEQPLDDKVDARYSKTGEEFIPKRWAPLGALIGIIPRAHDGALTTISLDPGNNCFATGGRDGVVVLWNIGFTSEGRLQHNILKTIEMPPEQTSGGYPCSMQWQGASGEAETLLIGMSSNSILEIATRSSELCLLITAHQNVTEALSSHPSKPMYATAGRDRIVRVWDAATRGLLCRGRLHAPAVSMAWSPNGEHIAVGTINGDCAILLVGDDGGARNGMSSVKTIVARRTNVRGNKNTNRVKSNMSPMDRKTRESREGSGPTKKSKPFKRYEEVQDCSYSPNGQFLALGSRDNNIYIFDASKNYKQIGVCTGHSSYITHIDWSSDSSILQSNDGAYELLYWEASNAKQITSSYSLRDVAWHSWTCVLGWPVQGIWLEESDGTDVNACSRSGQGDVIATADDYGMVRLYRYPAIRGVGKGKGPLPPHKAYRGHMSHVMNLRFLCNDTHLISVGGNDAAVFQWRHVNSDGSTVRTSIKQASNIAGDIKDGFLDGGTRVSGRGRVHGHGMF
eukprot:Stramenopile-MAST_4_protein_2813